MIRSLSSSRMSSLTRSVRRDISDLPFRIYGPGLDNCTDRAMPSPPRGRDREGLVRALLVVKLQDVAQLDSVEAFERDATLVAGLDFADVILEALEPAAARVCQHFAATHYLNQGVAGERAVQHVATSDV